MSRRSRTTSVIIAVVTSLCVLSAALFAASQAGTPLFRRQLIKGLVFYLILMLIGTFMWYADRRRRRREAHDCPRCGHKLAGYTSEMCPRCGARVDP